MRRMLITVLALSALAGPAAAQHAGHGAAPSFPAGWQGRLDRDTLKLSDVMFMSMGGGYHIKTGPHVILWNPENTASGNHRTTATFTQSKLSAHPEGYGLIGGGKNLTGANQDYGYFIIRQDGSFMVRHRFGTQLATVANWTKHAAINVPTATAPATNTLVVEAGAANVRFLVNGQEVYTMPRGPNVNTDGIAGLRIGHNVEVMVKDFAVQRLTPSPGK